MSKALQKFCNIPKNILTKTVRGYRARVRGKKIPPASVIHSNAGQIRLPHPSVISLRNNTINARSIR